MRCWRNTRNWANARSCAGSRRWEQAGKFRRMKYGWVRRRAAPHKRRNHCRRARKFPALAAVFAMTAIAVSMLFFLPTFPAFILIDWLDANSLDVFDSGISAPAAYGF